MTRIGVKIPGSCAHPWCYWIRIGKLSRTASGKASDAPSAKIDAELDGQTIRITSEGLKDATICLSSEMLDLNEPVTVSWNEKKAFQGKVERDFERSLETAVEKADWRGSFEAFVDLKAKK